MALPECWGLRLCMGVLLVSSIKIGGTGVRISGRDDACLRTVGGGEANIPLLERS